jgi:hypothetical protein
MNNGTDSNFRTSNAAVEWEYLGSECINCGRDYAVTASTATSAYRFCNSDCEAQHFFAICENQGNLGLQAR